MQADSVFILIAQIKRLQEISKPISLIALTWERGMVNSVSVMHFLPIKTGPLVKHGHSCLTWKPVQKLLITPNLWELPIRVLLKFAMTGKSTPIMI